MAHYTYEARDRQGQIIRGDIEAPSESAAAAELRGRGLFISKIRSTGSESRSVSKGSEGVMAQLFPKISLGKRALFWRQLHTLLNSGITISESMQHIAQGEKGHLKTISSAAAAQTSQGELLSSTLSQYPSSFPRAEIALIRAGEHAGGVSENIGVLADMAERELAVRRDFIIQLVYPFLVFLAILFIPLLPVLVLQGGAAAAAIIRDTYIPVALIVLVAFIVLRLVLLTVPPAALAWDAVKIKTPGTGAIVSRLAMAKATDMIATGYRSGLDLALSMDLAAESCGNRLLEKSLKSTVTSVRSGETLTSALSRAHSFPTRVMQMLSTGEKTGNIDDMMTRVAKAMRDEAYAYLRVASIVAGILALIIAGIIVGFKVISFYLGAVPNVEGF